MSHRIERWHREREPVPDPGGAGGAETNQWFFKTGAGEYGEALLILVGQHVRGDDRARRAIHQLYLRHTGSVNNWDLVDSSAAQIVGAHLATRDRRVLRRLARSPSVWERRIAMIATHYYIRQGDFADALAIAALLRDDEHDLIHKAVGWMLREIGKRNRAAEERFLRAPARGMPRTMLRYAIGNFPQPLRRRYMAR